MVRRGALNLCLVERCLKVGVLLSQEEPALLRFLDLQAANLHLVLQYCIFAAVHFQELALGGDGAADVAKLAVNTLSGCDVDMRTFPHVCTQLPPAASTRKPGQKCVGTHLLCTVTFSSSFCVFSAADWLETMNEDS
jgi:hypothetical protein